MNLEKALLYEQHRLPYPAELVGDLLQHTGAVQVVADIGAGTGQLARLFAKRSVKVFAVEPEPAMRQVGSGALAHFPAIEFRAGSAEETTLAEKSLDLIIVGNAFHRFRPEACSEFRRILKQEGWIALVAYTFTNRAFTDMLFPKLAALKGTASRIDNAWRRMPLEAVFGKGPIRATTYRQLHTQDWTALFGNACAGIEAPEHTQPDFGQFEALNREVFDAFAIDGKIQISYETGVSLGQPLFQQ
jgi:SAM-dependent methyltransferase